MKIDGKSALRKHLSDIEDRLRLHSTHEDGFADFVEGIPIGVYRVTPDGQILLANPALLDMLGYERFEELSQKHLEGRGFGPRCPFSQFKKQIERDGFMRDLESVWMRRDGRPLCVIEHARVIRDDKGAVLFYEGTVQDVTRQKQAENSLQSLIDAAQEEAFLIDPYGTLLAANRNFANEFGIAHHNLVGICVYDLLDSKLAEERRLRIAEVVQTGKSMQFQDRRNGKLLLHSICPIFDGVGHVTQIAIHASDLTYKTELNRYRKEMVRMEQMASVGVLSSMVYHSLKHPLSVISLSIEHVLAHLSKEDDSSGLRRSLELSLAAVEQLERMTKDILAVSRPPSLERGPVRFDQVARSTLSVLSEIAIEDGLRLETRGLEQMPAVDMNQAEAERMFFCLIENAIHASQGIADRTLIVSGRSHGSYVEIDFSDDCGGIASEHVERLFEPFFTTKSNELGTGLGLPIVQQIVESVGGKIRVDSRYGEGTTFHIRLPVFAKGR